ncbi:putative PWWP domain-containing protein [Rosa chinensis]|uniref:Putative PWWP domain-containing protein n=1 Tax=Rosa chinensis TaxID=74649 RepID=A0A2P6RXT9_ROSCH|nr:uncharacterized protein At1g51745 [Rosa chinensis]XP_024181784.1 uncharacterized protein At1g51745 [Rosa chinensis]PRQ51259.1 putative PWWP domain-containing protein [Rosa chinensis]
MGSSGDSGNNGIDASVGSLVWVRRRNGSWWPGRIVGLDELSEDFVVSPRAGTPVKLLGRDDASVDWYNLEKSKRVKAFRCGEYDECIEKAKAAAANPNKKAVKYARREDAIIHALEIENERISKDNINICSQMSNSGGDHDCSARESPATSHSGEENGDMTDDVGLSEENSDSALELSQSGISFEEPNHISSSKLQSVQGRRRRTPNDSEDDGNEGVKRMRGLQDLGMGVVSKRSVQTEGLLEIVQHDSASVLDANTQNGMCNGSLANGSKNSSSLRRKRTQVATANEFLKRKNRSRPLTKVLESTEMVSIPVAGDQVPNSSGSSLQLSDGKVPELEPNVSKRSLSMDHNGVSCDNDASTDAPEQATVSSSMNQMKENEILGKSELLENGSSKRFYDLRLVGEEKRSSGNSAVLAPCSSGRPEIGAMARQSSRSSQAEAAALRNERLNESGPTSSAPVHDIGQSIEKGSSKWQLKGKRNSRQTSRDRKNNSRKYMNVDDLSNTGLAGIHRSDVLCHVSDLKRNCNGISGSAAYNYAVQGKSKQVADLSDGPTQRSLPYRQSRFMVPARYQTSDSIARNTCSDTSLYDVKLEVKAKYRPQHVPLVSLMSKLNGKAIVGHPITVKALDDGYSDRLFGSTECDLRGGKVSYAVQRNAEIGRIPTKHLGSPKKSPKTKKSGLLPKKTRKLSSLTGHRQSEERKLLVEKRRSPVIACIPLKLVFSRINEAVSGLARPTHRALKPSET